LNVQIANYRVDRYATQFCARFWVTIKLDKITYGQSVVIWLKLGRVEVPRDYQWEEQID